MMNLGGCGFFLGSFIGILRSTHPVIFAVASGFQWSAVGATYWGSSLHCPILKGSVLNYIRGTKFGPSFAGH